jgi:hypothetical protein
MLQLCAIFLHEVVFLTLIFKTIFGGIVVLFKKMTAMLIMINIKGRKLLDSCSLHVLLSLPFFQYYKLLKLLMVG